MEIQTCIALPDNYCRAARLPQQIQYLVLHDAAGESAEKCAAQLSTSVLLQSVHYIVDADGVWQTVSTPDVAWHCGTRGTYFHCACRNENSIGIALCGEKGQGRPQISQRTRDCASALARKLLKLYSISPANVLRDYDVTHRCCPAMLVERASVWREFLHSLGASTEEQRANV